MLPNIVYSGLRNNNDWDRIQTRTMDPYSLLKSDTLNQVNTIYGNNTILTGMEMSSNRADGILSLNIKPGNCVKDKVLIQFKESTLIFIPYATDEIKELVKDNSIMVVVNYKYEKVIPAPIAKIEVIQEEDYDPEIHLGLYRIFFDSDGEVSEIVRLITPKDNVVYEQLLQEINSTATSAIYNVLGELGTEGIGALLGTYMRVKGTSISGNYTDKTYYLCDVIPHVSRNPVTNLGEVWQGSLHIITTFETNGKYYHNDYEIRIDPTTYPEEDPDWTVYTKFLTTDSGINSYLPYSDVLIYKDTENYYVYVWFKGNICGSVEVYETEFNSDQVAVKNISNKEPTSYETSVLALSDRTATIKSNSYINNNIVWNESNDGHYEDGAGPDSEGHGLDADLLDGKHRTYYEELVDRLRQELQEAVEDLNNKINELRAYVDETFIPFTEKDANGGVAVLTNTDGTYKHNGETVLDESEKGGVVPQSELYIFRMFGDDTHPESVEFTYSNKNPTGTNRINCEGHFHATKVYNPAYKDIAEVFEADQDCNMVNCVRKIMALDTSSGLIRKCRPTDYTIVGVCSDTYGYLLGASEDDITQTGHLLPIGLTGTVWVDIENTLEPDVNYLGCLIGVGAAGKGRIMARTDKRYCVGMVVECDPDKNAHRVKILLGNRWQS